MWFIRTGHLLPLLCGPILRLTCPLFTLLAVDRVQHEHSDWSEVMQPHTQQPAMSFVFWHLFIRTSSSLGLGRTGHSPHASWPCRWFTTGPSMLVTAPTSQQSCSVSLLHVFWLTDIAKRKQLLHINLHIEICRFFFFLINLFIIFAKHKSCRMLLDALYFLAPEGNRETRTVHTKLS